MIKGMKGPRVCVIGGRTGVGKTRVLQALRNNFNQTVIDLEGLAEHRGSTFGWCAQRAQPTSEHYNNLVATEWARSRSLPNTQWVFIEDEDDHVGSCMVPKGMYCMLRLAPLVVCLDVSKKARINLLVEMYAGEEAKKDVLWREKMIESVDRLQKRLGNDRCVALKQALKEDRVYDVAKDLLSYYDVLYDKHLVNSTGTGSGSGSRHGCVLTVTDTETTEVDAIKLAGLVLESVKEFERSSTTSV